VGVSQLRGLFVWLHGVIGPQRCGLPLEPPDLVGVWALEQHSGPPAGVESDLDCPSL
jgi:hypothetical protein